MSELHDSPQPTDSQPVGSDRQAAYLSPIERKRSELIADEGTDLHGRFLISNEANLYNTFPTLQENAIQGVGLYVGLDRGLDAMASVPQLEQMYIVDFDRTTSLTTLALLEVAQRHVELNGEFTDPNQFLNYFAEGNIDQTMQLISGSFQPKEADIIKASLSRTFRQHDSSNEESDADALMLHTYLSNKNKQQAYRSWVSDAEAINRIAKAYNAGKIRVANANLGGETGQSGMASVGKMIEQSGLPVSIIDISNVLSTGQSEETVHAIHANFGVVPTSPDYPVKLPIRDETLSVYSDSLIPRSTSREQIFSSSALRYSAGAGPSFGYFVQNMKDWRAQVKVFGEDTWAVNTRIGQQRQGVNQGITTSPTGISVAIAK